MWTKLKEETKFERGVKRSQVQKTRKKILVWINQIWKEKEVSKTGKEKKRHFREYEANDVCEKRNQVRKAKKEKFEIEDQVWETKKKKFELGEEIFRIATNLFVEKHSPMRTRVFNQHQAIDSSGPKKKEKEKRPP